MADLNEMQVDAPKITPRQDTGFLSDVAIPILQELDASVQSAMRQKKKQDELRQQEEDAANAELTMMATGGEIPPDIKQQSVAWQMSAMYQAGRARAIEEAKNVESEFDSSPETFLQKHGSIENAFQQIAAKWKPQIEQDEYAQKGFVESLQQLQQNIARKESNFVLKKQRETVDNNIETNLAGTFDAVFKTDTALTGETTPAGKATTQQTIKVSTTGKKFSPQVEQAISQAASQYGVPLDFMRVMAEIESEGNPNAKNKSGASGLYQFMLKTAKRFNLADRFDPIESAKGAARYILSNIKELSQKGITVDLNKTPYLGYLAHQQGAGGISQIVRAASGVGNVSSTVRRNMNANGGKGKTPQQFLDFWEAKYNRIAARLGIATVSGDIAQQPTQQQGQQTILPEQIESIRENIQSQVFAHPQGEIAAHDIAARSLIQMAVQHNRADVLTPEFFDSIGIANQYGDKLPQILAAQGRINKFYADQDAAKQALVKADKKKQGTLFIRSMREIFENDFASISEEQAGHLRTTLLELFNNDTENEILTNTQFLSLDSLITRKLNSQRSKEAVAQRRADKATEEKEKSEREKGITRFISEIKKVTDSRFLTLTKDEARNYINSLDFYLESGDLTTSAYLSIKTAINKKIERQLGVELEKDESTREKGITRFISEIRKVTDSRFLTLTKDKAESLINSLDSYLESGDLTTSAYLSIKTAINKKIERQLGVELEKDESTREKRVIRFISEIRKVTDDDFLALTKDKAESLINSLDSYLESGDLSNSIYLSTKAAINKKIERQAKDKLKEQEELKAEKLKIAEEKAKTELTGYLEQLRIGQPISKDESTKSLRDLVKLIDEDVSPIYIDDAKFIIDTVDKYEKTGLITRREAQNFIKKINKNTTRVESQLRKEQEEKRKLEQENAAKEAIRLSIINALRGETESTEILTSISEVYNDPKSPLSSSKKKKLVDIAFDDIGNFAIDGNGNLASAENAVAFVPSGLTQELASKSLAVFSATNHIPEQYRFFSGQLAALTGDLTNKTFDSVIPKLDAYTKLIERIEKENPNTYDKLLEGSDGKSSEAIYLLNKQLLKSDTPPQVRFNMLLELKDNFDIFETSLSQMDAVKSQKFMDLSRLSNKELKKLKEAGYEPFIDNIDDAFSSKLRTGLIDWAIGDVEFTDGLDVAAADYAKRLAIYRATGESNAGKLAAKDIAHEYEPVLIPDVRFIKIPDVPFIKRSTNIPTSTVPTSTVATPQTFERGLLSIRMAERKKDKVIEDTGIYKKAMLIPSSAFNKPVTVKSMGKQAVRPSITPKELSSVIEERKRQIVLDIAKKIRDDEPISQLEKEVFDDPNIIRVRYLKGTNTLFIMHPSE